MNVPRVLVCGAFDDLRARDIRFLEEASKLGPLTVCLAGDDAIAAATGQAPKFPLAERSYFLNAIRYVSAVCPWEDSDPPRADIVVRREGDHGAGCAVADGAVTQMIGEAALDGFPAPPPPVFTQGKKVVVTGCYDWFHTGHIRFFEEASGLGDLTVCLGNDACIEGLKGAGHPLIPQEERRYVVGAIRFVAQALISAGTGWLDADAEIRALKPDIFVVNEDGDKGGKRDYCAALGIDYRVLQRSPAPGLPQRSSTDLRGF